MKSRDFYSDLDPPVYVGTATAETPRLSFGSLEEHEAEIFDAADTAVYGEVAFVLGEPA